MDLIVLKRKYRKQKEKSNLNFFHRATPKSLKFSKFAGITGLQKEHNFSDKIYVFFTYLRIYVFKISVFALKHLFGLAINDTLSTYSLYSRKIQER